MAGRLSRVARRAAISDVARGVEGDGTWQNWPMIPWLRPGAPFPPLDSALDEPDGLLAASEALGPDRLEEAYRRGIFPWYSEGQPVLWWSPDPRFVLFVDEFRVARSLRKVIARETFEVRVDSAFRSTLSACAAVPRRGQEGTWITPAIADAYSALHARGLAHSVEAWRDGRLVGGLYGVSIGRMFYGESMFARETDASKVALAHLVAIVRKREMPLIDCQQETGHLASFGARAIPRREFARRVDALVNCTAPEDPWRVLPVEDVLR
jgi:leucyl/phenylalanyl-tRNA---protein transferase